MKDIKGLAVGVIALAAMLFGTNTWASNITNIESDASGTKVTLDSDPVITTIMSRGGGYSVDGYTYNNWAVLAEDSSANGGGGMELFGKMPTNNPATSPVQYTPTVGDTVFVQGTYSPFNNIPEIGTLSNVYATSSGNAVPTTPVFTVPQLNAYMGSPSNNIAIAGKLVEVQNVSIYYDSTLTLPAGGGTYPLGGNQAYYLGDGSTNALEMYFWASSYSVDGDMAGNTIPSGLVNVYGLVDQSGSFPPEIIPYSIVAVPEPSTVALVVVGLAGLLGLRRRSS